MFECTLGGSTVFPSQSVARTWTGLALFLHGRSWPLLVTPIVVASSDLNSIRLARSSSLTVSV